MIVVLQHYRVASKVAMHSSKGVQLAPLIAAVGTPVLDGIVLVPGQATNADGQLMKGGVSQISHSIVIVNEAVVLLLQLSIAV